MISDEFEKTLQKAQENARSLRPSIHDIRTPIVCDD